MLRNTVTKWLWDNRRSVIGWTVGIAAIGVFYGAMWPAFNTPEILATFEDYPEGLMGALNYTNIITAPGYIDATVYGLIVANIIVVYAVMTGTRIIAGDEETGTLDLILAHPISRTKAALHRYAAYWLSMLAITVGLLVAMLLLAGPAELEGVSASGLAAMHLHVLLFGTLMGAFVFAVGTATGRRSLTIGVSVGVAVLAFAANGPLKEIEGIEWIRNWSPYYWLNGTLPLENGIDAGHVLLMAGLSVALVAVGTFAFGRRDINV